MSRSAFALSVLLALESVPALAQEPAPRAGTTKTSRGTKKAGLKKKAPATKPLGKTKLSGTSKRKRKPTAAEAAPAPSDTPLSESLPLPPPPTPKAVESQQEQASSTLEGSQPGADERPWAQGISRTDQDASLALFGEGNALLKESIFVQAVEKYRQALARWDHPAIHYNLALALMNLDQPVEVHEHLVAALRFGPAPLEKEKYEYARNYKTLVEKQLARVAITCATPGATVTMDGQTLFVAPGRHEALVRPGAHSIVATMAGYLPSDQSRTLLPGETTTLDLKLFTSDDLIRYKRRWSGAMPWLVMGAGVAVAGGSAFLHLQSRDHFRAFESGIAECGGCVPPTAVADERSKGNLMQTGAIAGYAVGGAVIVTGAVLAVLNQPKPYRIEPGQEAATVQVTPLLGAGSGGAVATFRF
ncbi:MULTISPECIES: carboxypeptidase-like regulatory domain-containing protein [unclassified Corallococcus]|uniref:carboxypeptidase-like regulatory domain-containing protein n=1 Tax=unclassified Corallococcus TaxID=2685029 RepID=UPI001A9044E0|nr:MULTISPECIES: carboxypeptidase-like regulatory domain-containing protein [unclassified Corallococcus]MBN9682268.1 carboxypeptidase regulatory-like domain-containing protein [Corallococcus sp. NCSPR001]WAS86176.1 carboxypeptidase-like regulatory domain-containing protein [Corallococcus sp. NCRR]